MLSKLVVDFEACVDVSTKECLFPLERKKRTLDTHAEHNTGVIHGKDDSKRVPAPHLLENIDASGVKFRYRCAYFCILSQI